MLRFVSMAILLTRFLFAQQTPVTIYMPTGTAPVTQISGCTGAGPTVCTTITDHGLAAGDVVLVYMIVERAGSVNQLSAINAPAGSARKVSAAGLNHNTLSFTDLAGSPVNTANSVMVNSGFVRKAAPSTLNPGPRVGLDGTGGPVQMSVSATIMDGTLKSIVITGGGVATVNYAYPHGLTVGGSQIQVRNASAAALNGIHTVTVTSPTTVVYSAAAPNGTYTDLNLGVSSRAIDGQPAWEKIKGLSKFADSGHVNFVYQASQAQPSFGNCAAAAYYWYVDRSQTAMHDFAMGCIDRFEDFYPGPEFCREDMGPFCPVGNGNSRSQASDYVRIQVTNAATLYTLLRPQLTNAQKQNFANFFLNDTPDGCTHPAWLQGPGTMSSSGTAVTGVGSRFTSSFHVGDYVFAWDSASQEEAARVLSIADDTHMVITANFPAFPAGSPYWIVPAFQSPDAGSGAGCGVINFYSHHVASTATRDARLYVQPPPAGTVEATGYLPPAGDWMTSQGNNQQVTGTLASISIASAMAEDDPRALRLLQELGAWDYDYLGGDIIGTWGALLQAGPYYGLGRTIVWDLGTLKIGQRSIANFPDITAAPHNTGPKSQLYYYLYSHLPGSPDNDPWFSPWSYLGGGLSLSTQYSSLATLGAVAGGVEGQYMRYFLNHHATTWANGGSWYTEAPLMMAMLDPNAPGEADYTSLPLQVQLADTDASYCGSLGLACANGSPSFVQSNMARAAIVSRTGWSGSATIFNQTNLGGSSDVAGSPEDHGATIPGNYHVIKASSPGLGGCLIGDNDNSCVFGNGPGYGTGELTATTSLAAGTRLRSSDGKVNALFGPVLNRWSGKDKFGDASSRYAGSTWELGSYYTVAEGVTRAQRSYAHFKKPGTDEFILIYDDVAKTVGTPIAGYTQYPQGAPSGCCTSGTTTFSGGLLTSTNSDDFRVLTKWLAPAGGSSLAVTYDGTTYLGNQGDTMANRVTHCASTDGSTCDSAATGMEAVQAHYIATSSQAGFTATLLSPDSNWTGAQVAGGSDVKIALWARRGTLQSTITSFTPTYSGTAQILISGLTAGVYAVSVGGSRVNGSPFAVSAGDNSLYFEAHAGAIAINTTNAIPPIREALPGPPSGGGGWVINNGNWSARKQVSIAHAQVSGSAGLANFQMLFSSADPDFRYVAFGGKVGRTDGKDMFFTDANGAKLSHELVAYDATAGKVLAWVQAPSVSPATDTVLFVYFGNASAADQQDITGTWDANYQGVWHWANSSASSSDSSTHGLNLANHLAAPSSSPLGGAINLAGGNQYASAPLDGSSSAQFTVEYWVYSSVTPGGQEGQFQWASNNQPAAANPFLLLAQDPANNLRLYFDGGYRIVSAMSASRWNHVAVTWSANRVVTLYLNGVRAGAYDSGARPADLQQAQSIYFGAGLNSSYAGMEAEARVSSVARSADWIRTEYNNQSSPGTFCGLGVTQTNATDPADLTVTMSQNSNLSLGQTGVAYLISVSNSGAGSTTVPVWVSISTTAGLIATSTAGSGWTCTQPAGPCNRSDTLAGGAGYSPITLTMNVAANAPATVTTTVNVAGGGESNTSNNLASDTAAVTPSVVTPTRPAEPATSIWPVSAAPVNAWNWNNDPRPITVGVRLRSELDGYISGIRFYKGAGNNGAHVGLLYASNGSLLAQATSAGESVSGWQQINFSSPAAVLANTTYIAALFSESGTAVDARYFTGNGVDSPPLHALRSGVDGPSGLFSYSGGPQFPASSNLDSNYWVDVAFIGAAGSLTPDLAITSSHAGNFTWGQSGASYSITVRNGGAGPSAGNVTVTDTLPQGLTAASMSGANWTCTQPAGPCSRSDSLAAGGSYPAITLSVNVAANTPARVTNTVTVSGGGGSNAVNSQFSDPTIVNPAGSPVLSVAVSHAGSFTQGQIGATYSIVTSNVGSLPTSGTVTVADVVPSGLTAVALSGAGWSCNLAAVSCNRADSLAAGSAYPAITLTVNIAASASFQITNQASASGGGASLATGFDPTIINVHAPAGWTINGGVWSTRRPVTISHTQVSGSSGLNNFQMLISSVDSALRSVASGGLVGRDDGKDIFFTDAGGVKLSHELAAYDSAAGKVVAWVRAPVVSASADTVLYMYFGNAQSGDQQNAAGTWDVEYKGVWHLGSGSGLSLADSTANGATLVNQGAQAATGPTGGGAALDGSGHYLTTPLNGTSMGQFTLEYWVYSSAAPAWQAGQFQWATQNNPIAGDPFLLVAQDSNSTLSMYFDGGYQVKFAIPGSTWNHVAVTWDASHTASLYVNGVRRGSYFSGAQPVYQPQAQAVYFGTGYYASYTGREAEASISTVARSADWIRTRYNNQNSPGAFYTLGAPQ